MSKKLAPRDVTRLSEIEPGWTVAADGLSVSTTLEFASFAAAWGFMSQVAIEADKLDHHPEWSNVYNRVTIKLTTHDAGGLTEKDIALAEKIREAGSHR
jgi:4a-hydroxytetrahydrobiopterin dehydratase